MRVRFIAAASVCVALAVGLCWQTGCVWQKGGSTDTSVIRPPKTPYAYKLNRAAIDSSLALGRTFLLNNQRPEGNFCYLYDFLEKRDAVDDNAVRQAGSLWSLASIYREHPTPETRRAVDRGLQFFLENSRTGIYGGRYIKYPGDNMGHTGTVALVALALIEMLRSDVPVQEQLAYRKPLAEYMEFLDQLRRKDGLWAKNYELTTGRPGSETSPYYNGETLLAYCKATRYTDLKEYAPAAIESARTCYELYGVKALQFDRDSDLTKGFYQWGTMAFYDLYASGRDGTAEFGEHALSLATWMIHTHRVLERTRNTAYAFEGLCCAAEIARMQGDMEAAEYLKETIDTGLAKLTSWQVGGPMQNEFLRAHPTSDPRAVGGVMNGDDDPGLRIDVTQHQMHALLLARQFVYGE